MIYNGTHTTTNKDNVLTYEKLMAAFETFKNMPPCPPPIRIVETLFLTKPFQTKYPKKRKNRRWMKKYRKKYTIKIPSDEIYFIRDQVLLFCHPFYKQTIKEAIESGKQYNGSKWI